MASKTRGAKAPAPVDNPVDPPTTPPGNSANPSAPQGPSPAPRGPNPTAPPFTPGQSFAHVATTPAVTTDAIASALAPLVAQISALSQHMQQLQADSRSRASTPSPIHGTLPASDEVPAAHLPAIKERPFRTFTCTPPFTGGSHSTAALQLLASAERHYHAYTAYYSGPEDQSRVTDFRPALSGAAAIWFDGLEASGSPAMSRWSTFAELFRSTYATARSLENPYTDIMGLKMQKQFAACPDYVAEFNTRMSRLPGQPPVAFLVAAFRLGLPSGLAASVDNARTVRFGGTVEWPTLLEIVSTAMAMAHTSAPEPAPTPVLVAAAPSPPPPTIPLAPHEISADGRVTVEAATRRGGCGFCRILTHAETACRNKARMLERRGKPKEKGPDNGQAGNA